MIQTLGTGGPGAVLTAVFNMKGFKHWEQVALERC